MRTAAVLFIVLGGLAILLPLATHVEGPFGTDCGAGFAAIVRPADAGDGSTVQDCRSRAFRRELFYGGAGLFVLGAGVAMQLDLTDRDRRSREMKARLDHLEGLSRWQASQRYPPPS